MKPARYEVDFRPEARDELLDAKIWYEQQRSGLGGTFQQAIREAVGQILDHPRACPLVRREVRKKVVPRNFPYNIYYRIENRRIVVLAVCHMARRPGYWSDRA